MDNPVAMINVDGATEDWYYYYADAQGSIRLLTDDSGAITESYTYGPYGFGSVMASSGSDGNWLTEDVVTGFNARLNPPLLQFIVWFLLRIYWFWNPLFIRAARLFSYRMLFSF